MNRREERKDRNSNAVSFSFCFPSGANDAEEVDAGLGLALHHHDRKRLLPSRSRRVESRLRQDPPSASSLHPPLALRRARQQRIHQQS